MALTTNNNLAGFAGIAGNKTSSAINQSTQRIGSGLRINSAKDDAAGQALITAFASQITQNQQNIRNLSSGSALVQTAEGGLSSITDSLQRMRELAIQSSNGSNNSSDRQNLQKEYSQLQSHVGSVIDTTKYNGKNLLSESQSLSFTTDSTGASLGVNLQDVRQGSGTNQVLSNSNISNTDAAQLSIAAIDDALSEIGNLRAEFGAAQNSFGFATRAAEQAEISQAAAKSRIGDADIAAEISKKIQAQILEKFNIAIQAQANAEPRTVLQLLT